MDNMVSFKERVRQVAINESQNYKEIFLDYDYLICFDSLSIKRFYLITATEKNYAHLIGVNIKCSPYDFFVKCTDGSLMETDFDFVKPGQNEEDVKGTVRRKIMSLEKMKNFFKSKILVEESFKRNKIMCAIAASDSNITIGFSSGGKSYPKTLLKGNELSSNAVEPSLIFRKSKSSDLFSELIYGDKNDIAFYADMINHLITT